MEATMRFDLLKELKGGAFRRLTGVQRRTFEEMTALLFAAKCKQRAAGGKPNTLRIEDQLLRWPEVDWALMQSAAVNRVIPG
jgi:hypothetical protein